LGHVIVVFVVSIATLNHSLCGHALNRTSCKWYR